MKIVENDYENQNLKKDFRDFSPFLRKIEKELCKIEKTFIIRISTAHKTFFQKLSSRSSSDENFVTKVIPESIFQSPNYV